MMRNRAGKYIEEFKNLVYTPDYDPETQAASASKRKTPSETPAVKRVKEDKYPDIDMKAEAQLGKVKMTYLNIKINSYKGYQMWNAEDRYN